MLKIYGADLWEEYKEIAKRNKSLRDKVKKRMKYILEHSNDPFLDEYRRKNLGELGDFTTDTMIFIIMKVEENYVKQSTQLDLFDND